MITTKPPSRCPACGQQPVEVIKRWAIYHVPSGKTLRYPVMLAAVYGCGARIEAQFIVRTGLSQRLGGAFWRLDVVLGCRHAIADLMQKE